MHDDDVKPRGGFRAALREERVYLFGACLGLLYCVLCYFDLLHFAICPSKWILHIPCPSCGTTRALMKILHGDIVGGVMFNPNVVILIFLIFFIPFGFYMKHTRCPDFFSRVDRFLKRLYIIIPFAVFELCIWVRNIIVGM